MHVSPVGWGVAVLAVVSLVAGRLLGWGELAGLGVALVCALLVSVLMTAGRPRYGVVLDLADRRVRIGQRAVGRLDVRNAARRRSLPSQVELPVGERTAELAVPSLAPGAVHDELFAIPTDRRAVVVVGPVLSRRGDPLGLARRRLRWTEPYELFVHPEVVALGGANAGLLRDLEGQATRDLSDSDLNFHALRDYVAGDDRRYIHWRTTARTGQLMVKQFEDTRRTLTTVALATATGDYADADEFETAVSVAASIAVQAIRDEREVEVLAGPGRLRTGTPPLLLDDCARVASTAAGAGVALLGRRVVRETPDVSVAFLVTGGVPTDAEVRLGTRHLPAGTRAVVLRCTRGADVAVRTQGSTTLATLGRLEDLPRALRRVAG
ncbi:DUF58 domain-containing protein [Cellulomonas oligotrophica]|uniref:Uncharacterized protein (DUF58 family) n=1 Tax=Cellulomonas oligotrophica TaxID=931536 RepID=A0A7Y9JVX3_9CELL|nr:DUF58 domain-containing protein [Cellulomonas oligotrophica]NYD85083.1 uncharacterized protein (DUF58 family) [Cellulomonas oligotrophica]TQL03817.1 uncharacterized protein DUF58 [Cellulomonas sp. SLBN-39]GIG33788.1 hypothetical protein Col01nite_29470 [Cellulomonas oligotrophica]